MSEFCLKRLAAVAALSVLGSPALAGGLAEPAPVPVVPAPVVPVPVAPSADWTGGYVGGQIGMGTLTYNEDWPGIEDDFESEEFDGMTYGVHAGYMQDFGRLVVGGEFAYVMSDIEADLGTVDDGAGRVTDTLLSLDSVMRLGVRAGFDAGRVLPYATAGWARASTTLDLTVTSEAETVSASFEDTYDGYYFGGGVEFAVTDRFAVGAEILRHEFDVDELAGQRYPDELDATADLTTISLRGSFRF